MQVRTLYIGSICESGDRIHLFLEPSTMVEYRVSEKLLHWNTSTGKETLDEEFDLKFIAIDEFGELVEATPVSIQTEA